MLPCTSNFVEAPPSNCLAVCWFGFDSTLVVAPNEGVPQFRHREKYFQRHPSSLVRARCWLSHSEYGVVSALNLSPSERSTGSKPLQRRSSSHQRISINVSYCCNQLLQMCVTNGCSEMEHCLVGGARIQPVMTYDPIDFPVTISGGARMVPREGAGLFKPHAT